MKRVLENSRAPVLADAEARSKLRHEYLLEDYLDLQKEFVSKTKKLQEAKERKQTLLDEVQFLRGRYQYLMELQSRGTRTKKVLGVGNKGLKEWNNGAVKDVSEHSLPVLGREIEEDKVTEGKEEANWLRPRGTRTKEVLGVGNTGIEEWNNSAPKDVSQHSLPMLEREIEEDKVAEGTEEADWLRPGEPIKYKSSLKSNKRAKMKKNVWWQDEAATSR